MNSHKAVCPICEKPREAAFAPFCSKRCADIDLNRWLTGGYAIEGQADESDHGLDGEGLD